MKVDYRKKEIFLLRFSGWFCLFPATTYLYLWQNTHLIFCLVEVIVIALFAAFLLATAKSEMWAKPQNVWRLMIFALIFVAIVIFIPLFLTPYFRPKIWGGRKLDDIFHYDIPEEKVIGEAKDLFGGKIFKEIDERIGYAEKDINQENIREQVKDLKQRINNVTDSLVDKVKEKHSLTNKQAKKYSDNLKKEHDQKLNQVMEDYDRKKKILENKIAKKQNQAKTKDDLAKLDKELEVGQNNIINELAKDLTKLTTDVKENTPKKIVERVNYDEEVKKKNEVEQDVRSHLRGFSRTIPSFIMAYGDKNLNLRNFDDYTEDDVFEEVTGITEEQFRFLRDGGDYTDQESGQKVHFEGHLFDEVVFNDSIQEFLKKREELSNYFDDESTEDIFDYIPAQKTNQIYTPKAVVKHMVDDLEKNNPGIFDDPNKTFADLYMKSGLYITEIVKRLFRSQKMKELYPDDNERIRHIMEHQVYGFAPTRIIYLIATNYIFGFSDEIKNNALDKHFKQIDTAQYAKEGTLEELIQDEFGQEKY